MLKSVSFLITVLLFVECGSLKAQIFRPYKCGPVLKEEGIQIFDSLNQFLGLKPGMTFAEIGASSGYYNGAMAVFLDNVTFYIQDIDKKCLNESNLKKVLNYYSKFREEPIEETNEFHVVIGDHVKTNLPENTFDVIFSNATYHALSYPDSILVDIYKSLKIEGILSIRDEFIFNGIDRACEDKKCNPLVHYEDFINTLARNGFRLVDKTDQFGYPAYKFKKVK